MSAPHLDTVLGICLMIWCLGLQKGKKPQVLETVKVLVLNVTAFSTSQKQNSFTFAMMVQNSLTLH